MHKQYRFGHVLFALYVLLLPVYTLGQQIFNLLPQINADLDQSRIIAVDIDSSWIYTIGDLLDSTEENSQEFIKPWFGKFDYSGKLIFETKTENDTFNQRINIYGNQLIRLDEDNHIYYGSYYDTNDITKGIILKFNITSGQLVSFRIINSEYTNSHVLSSAIVRSAIDSSIIMINTIEIESRPRILIVRVDTNLNLINQILVDVNERENYAAYIEHQNNNQFVLIGTSIRRGDTSDFPDAKPFRMLVDQFGIILDFEVPLSISDKTVYFLTGTNTIHKNQSGYIFSCLAHFSNGNCSWCYFTIPKTYSVSQDFKSVFWERNSGDSIQNDTQRNVINCSIWNSKDNSYLLTGYEDYLHAKGSYLVKLSITGEEIWKRYFIPVAWEGEEIAWAILRDISIDANNNIICAGNASLITEGKWRSWIMRLDSLGCFVPGCEITSTDNQERENESIFDLYPNPANDFVCITYKGKQNREYKITLVDSQGKIIKSTWFELFENGQFVFNTSFLQTGIYFLVIRDVYGEIVKSIKFTVSG